MSNETAPETYIPVINHEDRNFRIAYYATPTREEVEERARLDETRGGRVVVPTEQVVFTMLGGLNYVPKSVFDASKISTDSSNVRFSVQGPESLDLHFAVELAKRTASKRSLAVWLSTEKRKRVVEALNEKLGI